MRAIVYRRFGPPDVLSVDEVPAPVPRGRANVVVDVAAFALNPKDVLEREGRFAALGARPPRVPGYDFAGVVRSAPGSAPVAPGDRVFGLVPGMAGGAMAERVCVTARALAPLPDRLSFVEGAALPLVSLTAWQALVERMRVRRGDHVLLHGASGGVGTVATPIAKALGLVVTASASARNESLVRSLGADRFVDYASADPLEERAAYDGIFDIFGNLSPTAADRALRPDGTFVSTVPRPRTVFDELFSWTGLRRRRLVVVRPHPGQLRAVARLCVEGRMRAVLDDVFAPAHIAAAFRKLETKRARGKIVVAWSGVT